MIDRALIALGGNEDGEGIGKFLGALAPEKRISVHGLGVVDIEGIEDSLSGAPVGAISMAEKAEQKVAEKEKKRVIAFVETFGNSFDKSRIEYDYSVVEGSPKEEILERSRGYDLLIVNSDSVFSYSREEKSPAFLSELIHKAFVPVIFFKKECKGTHTGIACDFGRDSTHSIYTFLHLGIHRGKKVIFSHVSSHGKMEKRFSDYIAHFSAHGYGEIQESALEGDKVSAIRRFVETEDIGLLVIGKKGEDTLKNYIFGSLTDALIKDPACSLFIHA